MKQKNMDVVIPVHAKDLRMLKRSITSINAHVSPPVRSIFIIGANRVLERIRSEKSLATPQIVLIDETQHFPFTIKTVQLHITTPRPGWILQNMLKLYAPRVLPTLSDDFLVVDADTVFLKPVEMLNSEGQLLYNYTVGYHPPFFSHITSLLPEVKRMFYDKSGITHHMIMRKSILNEIIDRVEKRHHCKFWVAFLNTIPRETQSKFPVSEFELYFNYVFQFHPKEVALRKLAFVDSCNRWNDSTLDYVSCHSYIRSQRLIVNALIVFVIVGLVVVLILGAVYYCTRQSRVVVATAGISQ